MRHNVFASFVHGELTSRNAAESIKVYISNVSIMLGRRIIINRTVGDKNHLVNALALYNVALKLWRYVNCKRVANHLCVNVKFLKSVLVRTVASRTSVNRLPSRSVEYVSYKSRAVFSH